MSQDKKNERDVAIVVIKIIVWILAALMVLNAFNDINTKLDKILEIHDMKQ